METPQPNSKQYFTSLRILHLALLSGQVIFALLAYGLNSKGEFAHDQDVNKGFQYLAPFLVISGIVLSYYLPKIRLNAIKQKSDLSERLADYRSISIIKWALLEGPSIFCIICFLLTANIIYLGLSALVVIVFVINKPSKNKLIEELELNQQEIMLLENDQTGS